MINKLVLLTSANFQEKTSCLLVRTLFWGFPGWLSLTYHARRNQFERFRWFLELISRFEFDILRRENYFFERFEFFGVFKVRSHTMWPYMCMCCGLFVTTQFHFECCGVRDDSQ